MKSVLRILASGLGILLLSGASIWGALALWYALPAASWVRLLLAIIMIALGVGGLFTAVLRRRLVVPMVPFAAAFATMMLWWSTIEPSNDRDWQPDVAVLPSAEVNGHLVTLRHIRNFKYRSETDYSPRWYDKTFDLQKLEALDLVAVYWMGDAIAHTMLSFDFGGEFVAISIEIRKSKDRVFSTLAGFFRQYELTYIVGDERDLIGLRTTYRNPAEDVFLYRVKAKPERIRSLFMEYIKKINQLTKEPEFYNSATTNCTTNIVTHVAAINPDWPLSWKMILTGYFPNLIYERGGLDQSLPFEILRRKSLINGRARSAGQAENFSQQIREGLVGLR
jgi:hypothetical protein